jgi:D-alanine-D-alanine ligase
VTARRLRVLLLTHADLLPPAGARARPPGSRPAPWGTERDLLDALERLGHEPQALGLNRSLVPLSRALETWRPDVVLNVLEEFRDLTRLAPDVIRAVERRGVPVTGCPAAALAGAHDKLRAKRRLAAAGLAVAPGLALRKGARLPDRLPFAAPLIVKSLTEHGSAGLTQASVVTSARALGAQARRLFRRIGSDVLVERYVEGRELYVAVLDGRALPPCELARASPATRPWIASERTKWDPAYQRAHGLSFGPAARLAPRARRAVLAAARRAASALGLEALARVDLRLDAAGVPWVIEVNPNPDVCSWGETATSARLAGLGYDRFVQRLLDGAIGRALTRTRARADAAPRRRARRARPHARGRSARARRNAAGSPARRARR